MGAYENPVTVVDTKSGQIWANAIQNLGAQASRILDQERDRLLQSNKNFAIKLQKIQEKGVEDYDMLSKALADSNITDQQIYNQAQFFQTAKTKASSKLLQTGRPPEELAEAQKEFNEANQALKGLIPYIKTRSESTLDYIEQIGNNPVNVGQQGYASMTENQEFQIGSWIDTGFLKGSKEIVYDENKGWGTKYIELDDKETGIDEKEFTIWGTQAANYLTTTIPTVDKSLENILVEAGIVDKNGRLTDVYQVILSDQTRTQTSKDGTIKSVIVGPDWEQAAIAINDRVNKIANGYLKNPKTANAVWRNVFGEAEDMKIAEGGSIDAEQAKIFTEKLKLRAGQYIPNVDYIEATDERAARFIQENPGAFERKSFKSTSSDNNNNNNSKTIPDYVSTIKLPMSKGTGPSEGEGKDFIDLGKLELVLAKPPANIKVKSSISSAGRQGTVFTKTIDGADRDITIYDNATAEEVRAQLEFLETGVSKKPEVNIEKLDFTLSPTN